MPKLETTVEGFLDHLETHRRVTPASLKNYRSTCRAFLKWTHEEERSLESSSVQDFVSRYSHAATANVHLVRLSGLVKYAGLPVEVTRAKEEIREVLALSSEEVEALVVASFELDKGLGHSCRFLAETGLRFDEFMRASSSHVKHSKGVVYLQVDGKGRKRRRVPLTNAAHEALRQLPSRTVYFEKQLRRGLAEAGIRAKLETHVHPHLLRASFISILLNERGAQAVHVAQIVGHSSVDTMLRHYAQVSMETLGGILAS